MEEVKKTDAGIDSVIEALRDGKFIDSRTENVWGTMYKTIGDFARQSAEEDEESPFRHPSFDGALKAVCFVAAIARDEQNECPGDVMDNIIVALVAERPRREDMLERLSRAAVANIKAGVNVINVEPEES